MIQFLYKDVFIGIKSEYNFLEIVNSKVNETISINVECVGNNYCSIITIKNCKERDFVFSEICKLFDMHEIIYSPVEIITTKKNKNIHDPIGIAMKKESKKLKNFNKKVIEVLSNG